MAKKKVRFEWKYHHLVEGGPRAWTAGALVIASSALAWHAIGQTSLAFVVLVAFWASLSSFLLPHRYELTEGEVVVSTPVSSRRQSWKSFRGLTRTRAGVLLTRLPRPSWLDGLRGLHLQLNGDDRILDFIRKKVSA